MDKIKSYFKRLWNAIWASTDIDEKAAAALKDFDLAKKGIAFNSLSNWSKKYSKNEFYADPLTLVKEIKKKWIQIFLQKDS